MEKGREPISIDVNKCETKKLYFENPDLFIFVQTTEEEQEEAITFLEKFQKELELMKHKPKILINCMKRTRVNTLNHAYQVNFEKMETTMWYDYGNPIKKCIWIKEFDLSIENLIPIFLSSEESVIKYNYEIKVKN